MHLEPLASGSSGGEPTFAALGSDVSDEQVDRTFAKVALQCRFSKPAGHDIAQRNRMVNDGDVRKAGILACEENCKHPA